MILCQVLCMYLADLERKIVFATFDDQTKVLFQTLLTSILLPFVISLLKNVSWSQRTKQIFAIVFSAFASFGILLFDNKLGKIDGILAILITILATQGNYKIWFSASPFESVLSNLFSDPQERSTGTTQGEHSIAQTQEQEETHLDLTTKEHDTA